MFRNLRLEEYRSFSAAKPCGKYVGSWLEDYRLGDMWRMGELGVQP